MSEPHSNKSGWWPGAAAGVLTLAHNSCFLRHFNIKSSQHNYRQQDLKKADKLWQTTHLVFFSPLHKETGDLWTLGRPLHARGVEWEGPEVEMGWERGQTEERESSLMSHHLWHVLEICLHVWAWALTSSKAACVFVHQQCVCVCMFKSDVHNSVYQALNKIICDSPPLPEFKAAPRFRLWGRGCSCATEKKKDCFPVRGAFCGKPRLCLPQPAFKELWSSAHLSSPEVLPSLPTSYFLSYRGVIHLRLHPSPPTHPPRPPSSNHTAAELWSGLHSGSWETFSQGALNPPAHTSSKQSAPGSLTFRHFLHVFITAVTLPHGRGPVTDAKNASASGLGSRPHTHLDFTREVFLIFERLEFA